ncbi:MAG: hypothetical protein ACYTEQ_18295 [Planctomycetota bacterium]|jgi:hypothetical protein
MALIKRVTGPRWISVIWEIERDGETAVILDPAIDPDKSDIKGYWDSMFQDESCLTYRPGEKPTRFRIRPMTPKQKDYAVGLNIRLLSMWRIRCGVMDIENYVQVDDDGAQKVDTGSARMGKSEVPGRPIAKRQWVEDLDLPEEYMMAIGKMIEHISEGKAPLSSNSAPPDGRGGRSDGKRSE